ncbi:MAG: sporulation protein YunB [bacterium]|nr:sporulation protein YunB [bacterium]
MLRFRRWLARRRQAARWRRSAPPLPPRGSLGPAVLALLVLVTASLLLLEWSIRPTLVLLAEARITNIAMEGMYRVVQKRAATLSYRELIHLEKDDRGRITMMQPNTTAINELAASTTLAIQQELAELSESSVGIPLGQVMGSKIFANYGPRIPVQLTPTAVPVVQVRDAMEAAGINQTKHTLYVEVAVTMKVVMPLLCTSVELHNSFPVAQTVLLGEVPQTYLNLDLSGFR